MMDEQTATRPTPGAPNSKPLVSRGLIVRLFLTCWLVYALHFATNTVREIYLALSIGDDLSFRVDDYEVFIPTCLISRGSGGILEPSTVRGKLRQRTVSLYRSMYYGLFSPGTI